jgi:hypothetical protein
VFLFVPATGPLGAQQLAHFDAGGGAGGSVFGWQPRVAVSGDLRAASLGPFEASLRAAFGRATTASSSLLELTTGARLSASTGTQGWWLGGDVVRRDGFRDAIERPRIETGGWHQVGNVVISISAARRSARFTSLSRFTREVETWNARLDSLTGSLDSTRVVRTVGDSSRIATSDRWAETEAGIAWQGARLAAAVRMGGRLASRGVPSAAWGSADVALRMAEPLALVFRAGSAAHSQFALDAEHRYLSLGFRLSPRFGRTTEREHPLINGSATAAFGIDGVGDGRYRLRLTAPLARRVELSGDFTGWKPVSLSRGSDGQWILLVALAPGTHRLNLRIDAGNWIAPPGLTTMSDDFAGEVGVLVIERESLRK